MLKWAADLTVDIDRDDWEDIWEFSAKTFICTTIKENIYNILYYLYLTPSRLKQIYLLVSDLCWRGYGQKGKASGGWRMWIVL
ncbi:hypothetical protein FKM82_018401 [Ascaphus truei]